MSPKEPAKFQPEDIGEMARQHRKPVSPEFKQSVFAKIRERAKERAQEKAKSKEKDKGKGFEL